MTKRICTYEDTEMKPCEVQAMDCESCDFYEDNHPSFTVRYDDEINSWIAQVDGEYKNSVWELDKKELKDADFGALLALADALGYDADWIAKTLGITM